MDWRRLIGISRPVGWAAAPLMMLLAVLNFGNPEITGLFYIELVLYTFPFCLFLYGINDVYDRDTDSKNNRKEEGSSFLAGRFLDENIDGFLKKYSSILTIALLAVPVIRQNLMHLLGVSMFLAFSYAYSAHPFRLKARAPLDSLSNSVIYFLGPFLIGLSYTTASIPWNFVLWMASATFAGHAFTTIMDYEPDKKAGLNTFAVRFGKKETTIFSVILFIALAATPSILPKLRATALFLGLVTVPMLKEDILEEYAAKGFRIYVVIIFASLTIITLSNLQLI